MERANGIEPSSSAWEAEVLPLYDARLGLQEYSPAGRQASWKRPLLVLISGPENAMLSNAEPLPSFEADKG